MKTQMLPNSLLVKAKRKPVSRYEVGVLSKALDIFDTLRNRNTATLTELSAILKFSKPTVFRILHTLESRGYVERAGDSKFRLTRKVGEPGNTHEVLERLVEASSAVMRQLVEQHQETVNLGIIDGGEIVVLRALESPQAMRMSSKAGNRRHIHSTALGKVLLAWKDAGEVGRLVRMKGMPRLTPRTKTTLEALEAELAKVRRRGYAEDNEENEPGGHCVAVPVRDPQGEMLAALSISGPVSRMSAKKIKIIAMDLKKAAEQLSTSL